MKLKRGYKKKWLAALRSGKYTQGYGYLRKDTLSIPKYCCLGVLYEVTKKEWGTVLNNTYYRTKEGSFSTFYTPEETFGLSPKNLSKLWRMNDSEEKTFKEIADWIEENVP